MYEKKLHSTIFGDDSEREPPVPIPNTEVKPFSANSTWLDTTWEGTHGKTIHMTYDLDEGATITTVVANHRGMLFLGRQWTQEAGQDYSVQIDCNSLRPGVYILYVNVNGKVYSEKVTI